MSRYENIVLDSEGVHDIVIETSFGQVSSESDLINVAQLIVTTLKSKVCEELDFELIGIKELEMTTEILNLTLRFNIYSTRFPDMATEDLARQKANFVMHLFAKIDELVPLGDVPFGNIYKTFIDLEDYYGI